MFLKRDEVFEIEDEVKEGYSGAMIYPGCPASWGWDGGSPAEPEEFDIPGTDEFVKKWVKLFLQKVKAVKTLSEEQKEEIENYSFDYAEDERVEFIGYQWPRTEEQLLAQWNY